MRKVDVKKWDVYWRLTIIEELDTEISNWRYYRVLKCQCSCWNVKSARLVNIRAGKTTSCGCYHHERQVELGKLWVHKMINALYTHGKSYTRIYRIYWNMRNRCYYEKHPEFKYWGWKGITCEWDTFEKFSKDMEHSYHEHAKIYWERNTTIDRIDNSKSYTKDNCRWATYKVQANNKW